MSAVQKYLIFRPYGYLTRKQAKKECTLKSHIFPLVPALLLLSYRTYQALSCF